MTTVQIILLGVALTLSLAGCGEGLHTTSSENSADNSSEAPPAETVPTETPAAENNEPPTPIIRKGIIGQLTTPNGNLNINQGAGFDTAREEIHDLEPYHTLALEVGAEGEKVRTGDMVFPRPLEGKYCHSMFWGKDWPLRGSKVRTELKRFSDLNLQLGQEYWQGIAWYTPDTPAMREVLSTTRPNNHILQWHAYSPSTGNFGLNTYSGNLFFKFGNKPENNVGKHVLGQWNKAVMHYKIANDNTGFIQLWINPKVVNGLPVDPPVYEYKNTPTYGEDIYFKWGIYRHHTPAPTQDIRYFYDSLRAGDKSSDF
ncbi:MAG: heparin lyase I family protein, partial [Bdellovibrionales bacterium]|nr:heparin lyase I family protein [Bdellovibrionales bacterium]